MSYSLNNKMVVPSNDAIFSTKIEMNLHNWSEQITEKMVKEVFDINDVGNVTSLVLDKQHATVTVDMWYHTQNACELLYALTFNKFFDVRVKNTKLKGAYDKRPVFLLFTVTDETRRKMQNISGPPGLKKKVNTVAPCMPYIRQQHV